MAQSTQRAVSDGTLVTLDLSINYLDRSEIAVYFDAALTTAWAWVGETAKQITFSPAVPDGVEVLVKRTTDISKLRHEFSQGAAFTAEVLDEDLTQVMHIAQEASETNLSGQFFADIDMHNYRIRNIGTAVDDTDALTLGQYKADADGAFASKTAAAASATAAANSATAAAGSATTAGTHATNAGNSATAAANSASAAATSATNAANASRLTAGTVTTGAPGTAAAVSITGEAGAQVLNVTVPRGDVGATGPQGIQGPQGPQGIPGPQGPAGAGSGDVLGPGTATVDSELVLWNGTTGTSIKRAAFSGLVKSTAGVASAAVAGTDYVVPSGSITGNAATATKLKTARTLTIGNTGKSFDGSGDVSWSLAEIGADASLTNYMPAGTGAVARTVQAKLREVVSVEDFGAVGDGVQDDTAAINAAIAYVNSKGGGTVFFPSSVYRIKSSVQYMAGVDLVGESMRNTTLKWHPDTNTAGSILVTSNQNLNRVRFENLRFTKDASITASTAGILGGSTLANYNSAIACFENLHFDGLTYGIRGNAEPTGVGLFDCYFKNIWCSGCFFGLWLFGSSNRVDHPRMTLCDTALALDYLNAESYDGMTVTGGTFVQNGYDVGVLSASGIRPVKFIGSWHEASANGIINVANAGSRVMNLDFIGCMLSTSSTVSLVNAANAVGTVSIDRCTLISGGSGAAQNFVRPTAAGARLLVNACQKYDSAGVASFVSDSNYFEAVKSGVNQSIPSATYTKLTWAAATLDSAHGFDNANDTYVIPVKGVYRVVASVAFSKHSVATNQNQVLMYTNGLFRRTEIGASSSSTTTTVTLDCLYACDAGDTVDIRVLHGNGTAIDVIGANDLTRFSVQFVSPQ